jgi:ABC-2 type transport system permease protein
MRAFLAVARNEWVQVWRDKWYLLLITVGAMSTLITLTYTLSTDIEGVTTLVVNLDNGRHGRQFVQSLANDRFFDLEIVVGERYEAERRLEEGSAKAVIVIPADLSRRVDRGEAVRVQVLIDGSEPGVAELAHNHVSAIANSVSQQLVIDGLGRQGVPVPALLKFRPRVRYNADLETIVSVVPGLMAVVLIVPSVGASAAFARERERGSFELVISTPLGRWPLLLGRVFPYVLIGLFDIGVFTAIGRFVFGVPLRGDLGLFVVLGLVYIFATASSGVFIAQFLRTQHAAAIITFELFGIAPTYISDIFFPVSSMPVWLQWLSALQPATHFTVVARGVFLKGVGWDVLWPNGLTLLAMGVVMSALAYARFQKKLA